MAVIHQRNALFPVEGGVAQGKLGTAHGVSLYADAEHLALDAGLHQLEVVRLAQDLVNACFIAVPGAFAVRRYVLKAVTRPIRWDSDHVVLFDDETKEICKEIVRCGGLDGRVNIALDYFDASINRISAWTVGFRNVEKALLSALCTPHTVLKELQDTNQFTELMVRQEELKTLPFGEVWDEYCRRNGVPVDGAWFEEVKKYEQNVLSKRI